jgi:hypothetical protein
MVYTQIRGHIMGIFKFILNAASKSRDSVYLWQIFQENQGFANWQEITLREVWLKEEWS